MSIFINDNGQKKIKSIYINVNGVAKKVKIGSCNVNSTSKNFYTGSYYLLKNGVLQNDSQWASWVVAGTDTKPSELPYFRGVTKYDSIGAWGRGILLSDKMIIASYTKVCIRFMIKNSYSHKCNVRLYADFSSYYVEKQIQEVDFNKEFIISFPISYWMINDSKGICVQFSAELKTTLEGYWYDMWLE